MRKGSKKSKLTFNIPNTYNGGGSLADSYNSQIQQEQQRNQQIGSTIGGVALGAIGTSLGVPPMISAPIGAALGKQIGGLFPDGGNLLTYYNTGSTHEQNPNGGVELGNTGNKVEEGEYRMDDRILSKRLGYADKMKKYDKKLKLRPNDHLTKELVEQKFDELYQHQESTKMLESLGKMYPDGGILGDIPMSADSAKTQLNTYANPNTLGINPAMFDPTKATINPDGSRTIPGIKPVANTPQYTGIPNFTPKPDSNYSVEGNKYYKLFRGQKMPITQNTYNFETSRANGGPVSKEDSLQIVNTINTNPLYSSKYRYNVDVDPKGKKSDILYRMNAKSGTKTPVNFQNMNALERMAIKHKIDLDLQAEGKQPIYNVFAPDVPLTAEHAAGGTLDPFKPNDEQVYLGDNPLGLPQAGLQPTPEMIGDNSKQLSDPEAALLAQQFADIEKKAATNPNQAPNKAASSQSQVPQGELNPLAVGAQALSPLYQAGLGLLNKDNVNYQAPELRGVNPYYQAQLQEQAANEQLNRSKAAIREGSNSQGTYLAAMNNLGATGANVVGQQVGQTVGAANQYNTGINNQNIAAKAGVNNQNIDANEQIKDRSRQTVNAALLSTGNIAAGAIKDNNAYNSNNLYNQSANSTISQLYQNYEPSVDASGNVTFKFKGGDQKKKGGKLYKRGGKLMNYC